MHSEDERSYIFMELKLNDLRKSFDKKEVLQGASFTFEEGRIYGLLGRNGAGKTTLFNCLSNEINPDGGTAELIFPDGRTSPLSVDEVGYVLSSPVLPEFLTGFEFIRFYMDVHQGGADRSMTADDYFDLVKLDRADRHRLIKGYSHGMKNKLQMLLFIISKPPVILLDEPLTSFDVVVALEIKELIKHMKEKHIIIFSTHILQLATDLCDELVILNDGKLSGLDSSMLGSRDFERRIIELLKDKEQE